MPDHPFEAIAGTWRGDGAGSYPTIADFAYTEQLLVEPVPGRMIAHWRSGTRDLETGEPRHAESGFLRMTPAGVELVLAHGFGLVEVATGSFDGSLLQLASSSIVGSPSAKAVASVERRIELVDDELRYEVGMAAVGVPMTHHLRAALRRDGS